MSHLVRTTPIDAPFSSVIVYVADFFDERPQLRLKAFASTTISVQTRSKLIEDRIDTVRRHEALALSWYARWSLFPTFEGRITVRPQSPGSELAIEGWYDPPGGQAGRVFDRVIGRRLAHGSIDHLLGRLRLYVERRHRSFQATCPKIGQLNELERISSKGFDLHSSPRSAKAIDMARPLNSSPLEKHI